MLLTSTAFSTNSLTRLKAMIALSSESIGLFLRSSLVVYLWYIGLICLMVVLGPAQEEDVTEDIERSAPCHNVHVLPFKIHCGPILPVFTNSAAILFCYDPSSSGERKNGLLQYHHFLFSDILTACCQNQNVCWISSRGSSCTCALTFP